jgi:hypothetical protein
MIVPSVIFSNIYLYRPSLCPTKNHPPLIIDSNAMESLEISFESFEPVSRWRRKVTQSFSIIQQVELPGRYSLDTGPPNTLADLALSEESFYSRISEALDGHRVLYHHKVYLIKVFIYQAMKDGRGRPWETVCR